MPKTPAEMNVDLRALIEKNYEMFRNQHRMMDRLETRFAYYTMAIGEFTKSPHEDVFMQELVMGILQELLKDVSALLQYEIMSRRPQKF